jgi:hypothetical protein
MSKKGRTKMGDAFLEMLNLNQLRKLRSLVDRRISEMTEEED